MVREALRFLFALVVIAFFLGLVLGLYLGLRAGVPDTASTDGVIVPVLLGTVL